MDLSPQRKVAAGASAAAVETWGRTLSLRDKSLRDKSNKQKQSARQDKKNHKLE